MNVAGARKPNGTGDASRAYSLAAIPPQPFDKYTLIGKLGHGGMAEVNLAVADGRGGFRKLTVIKRLHAHLAMEPGFIDMFLDEARLAARLNHPHCVQTYEVGEFENSHFLAMEYLDGQGLERLLRISGEKDLPIPVDIAARMISDALDGLAYAHELTDYDGTPLGVVHRDVSPQNIFVTYNGMVKLLDFGIAKAATHVVETKTGVIKGKYAYIAPEQALGADVDQRSDLWSMGVVLWEVLTGRRLFKSVNELATLHETLQGEIKLPSAYRPELPTDLDTICMRALQRDPNERYQSAQEMKEDLDRYLLSLQKVPVRRHVARLMKERFDEVIELHKKTLAACLQGSGTGVSTQTIERLVEPASHSGIRPSGAGMTPTPTPSPYGAPASVTPPPMGGPELASLTPPPMAMGAPAPEASSGWVWKAALVIGVILLAVIAAILLPIGDDPEPVASVGLASPVGSTTLPTEATRPSEPVANGPVANDPGANDPGANDPGTAPVPVAATPDPLEEGPSVQVEPIELEPTTDDPETDEQTAEPEAGSAEPSARALARMRAARQRREREREQQQTQTQTQAPPPEPERAAVAETGTLTLATTPWTHVSLGGRDLGTTPLINFELPAGSHTLRLVNREQGIDETYRVTIRAGERVSRRVGLR